MPWNIVHRCVEGGPPMRYVAAQRGDKVLLACAACGDTLELDGDSAALGPSTHEEEQAGSPEPAGGDET